MTTCLQLVDWLKSWFTATEDLVDVVYPVGSIYMSVSSTSPATLFGGTWEQIEDKFLLASGSTYSNGSTGGSATVSLIQSQMPRHTHTQNAHRHEQYGNYSAGSSGSSSGYTYHADRTITSAYTDYTTAVNRYTGGNGSGESASNGLPHENMPPYLTVNVWKRTA